MNTRSFLYFIARVMGDISAVKRGRVGTRIYNRGLGKILGRLFR